MEQKLTVLSVNVEISDQMGTSCNYVIGVFDSETAVSAAKTTVESQIRDRRFGFIEDKVAMNHPLRINFRGY